MGVDGGAEVKRNKQISSNKAVGGALARPSRQR